MHRKSICEVLLLRHRCPSTMSELALIENWSGWVFTPHKCKTGTDLNIQVAAHSRCQYKSADIKPCVRLTRITFSRLLCTHFCSWTHPVKCCESLMHMNVALPPTLRNTPQPGSVQLHWAEWQSFISENTECLIGLRWRQTNVSDANPKRIPLV